MEVELLYIKGCPNRELAESRLQLAAEHLGRAVTVTSRMVESLAAAERLGFRGSPTLLANGADLFPAGAATPGITCRLYPTEHGLEGAPSLAGLMEVMSLSENTSDAS